MNDRQKRFVQWSDTALTAALLGAATVIVAIAFLTPPLAKAAALAWVVFP